VNDVTRRFGAEDEPDVGTGLSIQRVSQLLAVPAPTIRSWERRYGVPSAPRSTGGHRRYFPTELVALRLMRDEISRGRRAADAAAAVRASSSTHLPHHDFIAAFLDAAFQLDPRRVRAVLDDAQVTLGLDEAVAGVLMPSMRQIGRWWETGRCDVAHEHLATEASRAWLNRRQLLGPGPSNPETIILTCGPRDFHTLGLEGFGALLANRGWECRTLGARTPPRSLAAAVAGTEASVVVMVSHLAVARRAAVEAMRTTQLSEARLYYAGNAFASSQARRDVPGTYLGEHVAQAADVLTAELVARRAAQLDA